MTTFVIIAFMAIFASLGAALYFMMRGGRNASSTSQKMARALAARVGFSIFLFLCILIAWRLGYIHPTGISAGQ